LPRSRAGSRCAPWSSNRRSSRRSKVALLPRRSMRPRPTPIRPWPMPIRKRRPRRTRRRPTLPCRQRCTPSRRHPRPVRRCDPRRRHRARRSRNPPRLRPTLLRRSRRRSTSGGRRHRRLRVRLERMAQINRSRKSRHSQHPRRHPRVSARCRKYCSATDERVFPPVLTHMRSSCARLTPRAHPSPWQKQQWQSRKGYCEEWMDPRVKPTVTPVNVRR